MIGISCQHSINNVSNKDQMIFLTSKLDNVMDKNSQNFKDQISMTLLKFGSSKKYLMSTSWRKIEKQNLRKQFLLYVHSQVWYLCIWFHLDEHPTPQEPLSWTVLKNFNRWKKNIYFFFLDKRSQTFIMTIKKKNEFDII